MPSIFKMLPLIVQQNLGKQRLARTPEPHRVTDQLENVIQYDRVMETKLAISYAIAIETIYRTRTVPFGGRALDVCCGPGHLALNMAKELKLDSMIGVDLSPPMIEVAAQNAKDRNLRQASFQTGDATALDEFADSEFDLTTLMDAAHHMPNLDVLQKVLRELDRVTRTDGLVFVMDLVRLRTGRLTETYINLLAHDYVKRGLPNFLQDFRDSMYAAWTPAELSMAAPKKTQRKWSLLVPRGLPFAQFLIGHPATRPQLFIDREPLWKIEDVPVTAENRGDYKMAKLTLAGASARTL